MHVNNFRLVRTFLDYYHIINYYQLDSFITQMPLTNPMSWCGRSKRGVCKLRLLCVIWCGRRNMAFALQLLCFCLLEFVHIWMGHTKSDLNQTQRRLLKRFSNYNGKLHSTPMLAVHLCNSGEKKPHVHSRPVVKLYRRCALCRICLNTDANFNYFL